MEKRTESGRETTRSGDDLARRVVAIDIFGSVVVVYAGRSGGDVMLKCGDQGKVFRERHRFIWWLEVLGGKNWRRRRIFLASPRVWDDREFVRIILEFLSGRRFRGEEIV